MAASQSSGRFSDCTKLVSSHFAESSFITAPNTRQDVKLFCKRRVRSSAHLPDAPALALSNSGRHSGKMPSDMKQYMKDKIAPEVPGTE